MLYNEEKSKARREAFKNYKNYGIIIVLTLVPNKGNTVTVTSVSTMIIP